MSTLIKLAKKINTQLSTDITTEIENRIRDGEKLNIDSLVQEYYPELHPLEALTRIRGKLYTVRNRLAKEGIAACAIGTKTFGVPTNQREYVFGQMNYYRHIKGLIVHANNLYQFGSKKNLLPANFQLKSFKLPSFTK